MARRIKKTPDPLAELHTRHQEMVKKLSTLSLVSVRQFMGTRREGDPRVEYLRSLERFHNLATAQLRALQRLAIEKLGVSREDFLNIFLEELEQQVKSMEEDLCVVDWDKQGKPIFNLQAFRTRTEGWPV